MRDICNYARTQVRYGAVTPDGKSMPVIPEHNSKPAYTLVQVKPTSAQAQVEASCAREKVSSPASYARAKVKSIGKFRVRP